jgi:hypothetical protein
MGKAIQWFIFSAAALLLAILWIMRMPAVRAVEAVVLIALSFASGVYFMRGISKLSKSK